MPSRTIMLRVMGQMKRTPAIPRGMSKVSAASGPYAAELRASSPNTGMPSCGTNPLGLVLVGGQRAAEQHVDKFHGIISVMDEFSFRLAGEMVVTDTWSIGKSPWIS